MRKETVVITHLYLKELLLGFFSYTSLKNCQFGSDISSFVSSLPFSAALNCTMGFAERLLGSLEKTVISFGKLGYAVRKSKDPHTVVSKLCKQFMVPGTEHMEDKSPTLPFHYIVFYPDLEGNKYQCKLSIHQCLEFSSNWSK